jgi:hypothetical protein
MEVGVEDGVADGVAVGVEDGVANVVEQAARSGMKSSTRMMRNPSRGFEKIRLNMTTSKIRTRRYGLCKQVFS